MIGPKQKQHEGDYQGKYANTNGIDNESSYQLVFDPGLGFEPRIASSEPAVMPLHHPGICL